MNKIRNKRLAGLLAWSAQITGKPVFNSFHEFVRKTDLNIFPGLISWTLKNFVGDENFELLPRNSIQTPGAFNCFRSDIDFSAVFNEEPAPQQIRKLLRAYERIGRVFPFLGELEIYTKYEWRLKSDLHLRFMSIVELIWLLRKWRHQLQSLEGAKTSYHELKARNAVQGIRSRLGLSPEALAGENLNVSLVEIIEKTLADFLPGELIQQGRHEFPLLEHSLYLEWDLPQMNLCFAAILPDGDWLFSSHVELIRKLRENRKIRELFLAHSRIEFITLSHHKRIGDIEVDGAWYEYLDQVSRPKPHVIWFTGLPESGKTTLALALSKALKSLHLPVEHLDGDEIRKLTPKLGFTRKDRTEHLRRMGELAQQYEANGVFTIASFVSPYRDARDFARELCTNFIEVHVSTPLGECEKRDTKGNYAKARKGEITHFTGVHDPYEEPLHPELKIDTTATTTDAAIGQILELLFTRTQ